MEPRLLFKNAPWKEINARIAGRLQTVPTEGSVQEQADGLMDTVLEAVHELTPKAKPSHYAKRWWTTELTQLRRIYTYWRNRARSARRGGQAQPELERLAKEASKQYHDDIRRRKKAHWDDFLADNTNIWKAAKYLDTEGGGSFDKVPQLARADGTRTTNGTEQAEELLATFFPPLPGEIAEEGPRPQRSPIDMPEITLGEIEAQLFGMKPWKAPGADGLPLIAWRQVWPVVRHRVLKLFRKTVEEGALPNQWRHAKIVPLKKPGKGDYTIAKAWRPISLLSTLGKVLEAVIAERISYAVEEFGLLPSNHFGARKRRSAEQALMLLQEHIFKAWRGRQVVSLVSFDVKGAYNGVYKDRLLQRLAARGIPPQLVRWVGAFCSGRTASIDVNGQASEKRDLPQAGLPQGSPLSPVLFLFFNADLVQHRIAEANRGGIQGIIEKALNWESRSGATFEADKTAIIHFSRNAERVDGTPYIIKGRTVNPKEEVKVLGVILDQQLRYKKHIARAATKGLKAAMALRRLRGLAPSVARQLYTSTVAPVMDYASCIWMNACGETLVKPLDRVQNVGAQAIVGTFRMHTLPRNHPLVHFMTRSTRRFTSPLQRIAAAHEGIPVDNSEIIKPFVLGPWKKRINLLQEKDVTTALSEGAPQDPTVITTSTSTRSDTVGIGITTRTPRAIWAAEGVFTERARLGPRDMQNPFTAELAAMHKGLDAHDRMLDAVNRIVRETSRRLVFGNIVILTRNKAATQAITKPRGQSGQADMERIYATVDRLREKGVTVSNGWIPTDAESELTRAAKRAAQCAADPEQPLKKEPYRAVSTTLAAARKAQGGHLSLPADVGRYSKRIDTALPGRHTRWIYDGLSAAQASVLAQLRTGMTRLNTYLRKIGAALDVECACGQAAETVEHFLFRCLRWTSLRAEMQQVTRSKTGSLSFHLGGKAPTDPKDWKPNMAAVQATIKYAMATGRLNEGQKTT
ncbi:RNA-directed DNA polymerase mobile element jockey like protein [Verticillium longisporum]|nr:RNA-directed DNA polymerase mobile element jockey like protein [Verticillium longisporum]